MHKMWEDREARTKAWFQVPGAAGGGEKGGGGSLEGVRGEGRERPLEPYQESHELEVVPPL
jgi:hypothetical protein